MNIAVMQVSNNTIMSRRAFLRCLFFMDIRKEILQGVSIDLCGFGFFQLYPNDVISNFIVLDPMILRKNR